MARDGVWVQPAPAHALAFLSACRAVVGLCRSRAAAASLNTLQTESRRVVNNRPRALQGLIKQRCIGPGKTEML